MSIFKTLLVVALFSSPLFSQKKETVKLPFIKVDDVKWIGNEKKYYTQNWKTEVITNISEPSINIYHPKEDIKNGTAVIIAPGGALYALSIINEGDKIVKWLNKKGITAIILKYRLIPAEAEDAIDEYKILNKKHPEKLQENVTKVIPYSIEDGLNAISYLRKNAIKLGINPNKIGFMGFSAGGAVAMGVSYHYTSKNRPDFLIPVYPWTTKYPVQKPQKNAPPIFIVCASNDPLKLALGSINIYQSWKELDLSAELHMYAKGGHGFGLKTQEMPSDNWIQRFYEWALNEKFIIPKK